MTTSKRSSDFPALHVLSYGSLMFDPVWQRVVEGRYASVEASAKGLTRQGVRGEKYPGVFRDPTGVVEGRLHLNVSVADLARVDAFEGEDYERVTTTVTVLSDAPAGTDGAPAKGAVVEAEVYLFLPVTLLNGEAWDVEAFEKHGLAQVVETYVGR